VPAARVAFAALKRAAVVGSPTAQFVVVVIVVVTRATTDSMIELAGSKLADVSVVRPEVLRVSNSVAIP
jgi:hypothetical protein